MNKNGLSTQIYSQSEQMTFDRLYSNVFSGDELAISQQQDFVLTPSPSFTERIADCLPHLLNRIPKQQKKKIPISIYALVDEHVRMKYANEVREQIEIQTADEMSQLLTNSPIKSYYTTKGVPRSPFVAIIHYKPEFIVPAHLRKKAAANAIVFDCDTQTIRGDKFTNEPPQMIRNLYGFCLKKKQFAKSIKIIAERELYPHNIVYGYENGNVYCNRVEQYLKLLA